MREQFILPFTNKEVRRAGNEMQEKKKDRNRKKTNTQQANKADTHIKRSVQTE
jgi:hypothetical protein